MPERKETYKGHKITVKDNDDTAKLVVDSKEINVFKSPNGYSAAELYYVEYGSLMSLARAYVDQLPDE